MTPRYGAFAYSEADRWLGYSSQHDDPEAAKAEALGHCDREDAVVLCCECDTWLAFALSPSTGGYWWATGDDGPSAAGAAVEELTRESGADDIELIVCYATNDGEEYEPPPPPPPPADPQPAEQRPAGRGWETAKKVAEVAGSFVRGFVKGG
jgi:hypothetical protein